MIAAFDIDGTISNTDHRHELAVAKQWDAFHALAPKDTPIRPTLMVLQALHMVGHTIELWTARPEKYRGITEGWLDQHRIPFHKLVMRKDGDWRPAAEVKLEWFKLAKACDRAPGVVFDDHPGIVAAIRAEGGIAFQVDEGYHSKGGGDMKHYFDEHLDFVNAPGQQIAAQSLPILGLGMCGEAGEVVEHVKKHLRDGVPLVGNEKFALALELGDALWYLLRLINHSGYTPEQVMKMNRAKLEARRAWKA